MKKNWFTGFFPMAVFDGLKRQQLISIGSLITFILLISPIFIWLSYKPASINNPIIGLAKFNAFMAISTLSMNFFLSSRLKILERLFNGLDRMYRVHKVVGRSSLFFMMLHPFFLIISSFPDTQSAVSLIIPLGSTEVNAGIIALYLFLLLLALTVAVRIPYHLWHNSHKVLGVVLLLAGFHAVFAGSDIQSYPILRFWIIFLCSLGTVSWVYMAVFYRIFGPKFKVALDQVDHFQNITELTFKKPVGFNPKPGQYLFIRFPRFEGKKELFPFSISNDPSQNKIRISINRSGDYTSEKVPMLKKGDKAIVMGPYGTFGERYLKHDKDMVWIAGGIGITPFLSLAKHESISPTQRHILLIWAIKRKQDGFHDDELKRESKKNDDFQYVPWISEEQGRITAADIVQFVGGISELKKRIIFMCGPPGMMYSLCHGLHRMEIPFDHIIFEDFNMLD